METGDLPLKQRVADAMAEADKKTAHLYRGSDACARLWMRVFHDTAVGHYTRTRLDQSDQAYVTLASRTGPVTNGRHVACH